MLQYFVLLVVDNHGGPAWCTVGPNRCTIMSVELTVIPNCLSAQLTGNHLFGQLDRINKTSSPAFGSTDRKSSFWYVEPAKEDSMAEFKLSLTDNRLFLYVEPTKQDLLAEFKLSQTGNRLFGTFCQQKKTQCPISNSTANLQSIHQKKVSFVFINYPSQHGSNSYRPAQAYASHSPGSNSSLSLLLLASALATVGQSPRLVVHKPVQDVLDSLDLPATY
jgi:hypothetical protein